MDQPSVPFPMSEMDFVMRTLRNLFPSISRIAAASLLMGIGCNRSDSDREPVSAKATPPAEVFTVHIDAGNNGAAPAAMKSTEGRDARKPRALIFESSGVARLPADGGSQEQWASAREAAVLDGFAKGIMEARRMAGLPDDEFTEQFSSRLTVAQRISSSGEEFEVKLLDRGMERLFLLRDGILQHPPHDFELVRKIFSETAGEFRLLPVDDAPLDRMVAKIGCYEKADMNSRFADQADGAAQSGGYDASEAQTP